MWIQRWKQKLIREWLKIKDVLTSVGFVLLAIAGLITITIMIPIILIGVLAIALVIAFKLFHEKRVKDRKKKSYITTY